MTGSSSGRYEDDAVVAGAAAAAQLLQHTRQRGYGQQSAACCSAEVVAGAEAAAASAPVQCSYVWQQPRSSGRGMATSGLTIGWLEDCCSWEEERDTAINITMECLTVMEWPGELVVSYVCDFGLN